MNNIKVKSEALSPLPSNHVGGRISPMKTYFQRWLLINRLHRFSKMEGGVVWISKEPFIRYLRSFLTTPDEGHVCDSLKFPYNWLFDTRTDLLLDATIRNLILECSDPEDGIRYLILGRDDFMRLSALGRSNYEVTSLIFFTDFGKKVWTGVIVAVVGAFLVGQLHNATNAPNSERLPDHIHRHR